MSAKPAEILLIDHNTGDSWLIQQLLAETQAPPFEVEVAPQLALGLERLTTGHFLAVLAALTLPDSQGLDTFFRLRAQAPTLPLLVLTSAGDKALGVIAVREGAQDSLVKGQFNSQQLAHAITQAIARQSFQAEYQAQAHLDSLTGLFSRHSFFLLANQHWRLAYRTNHPFLLVLADIDNLKKINDTLSPRVGDAALRQAAQLLRQTFRDSDLLARLAGDEFIILLTEVPPDGGEKLITRLKRNFANYQRREDSSFALELSIGATSFDPAEPVTLEELIHRAEQVRLADKAHRHKAAAR